MVPLSDPTPPRALIDPSSRGVANSLVPRRAGLGPAFSIGGAVVNQPSLDGATYRRQLRRRRARSGPGKVRARACADAARRTRCCRASRPWRSEWRCRHCDNRLATVVSAGRATDQGEGRRPLRAPGRGRWGRQRVVATARPAVRPRPWPQAGERLLSVAAQPVLPLYPVATSLAAGGCGSRIGIERGRLRRRFGAGWRRRGGHSQRGWLDRFWRAAVHPRRHGRRNRLPTRPGRLIPKQRPATAQRDQDDDAPQHGLAARAPEWRANPLAGPELPMRVVRIRIEGVVGCL